MSAQPDVVWPSEGGSIELYRILCSPYIHCIISSMQFLLGVFYYVEAATLLEDFETKLNHTEGHIQGVEYYHSDNVTRAYRTAAL